MHMCTRLCCDLVTSHEISSGQQKTAFITNVDILPIKHAIPGPSIEGQGAAIKQIGQGPINSINWIIFSSLWVNNAVNSCIKWLSRAGKKSWFGILQGILRLCPWG